MSSEGRICLVDDNPEFRESAAWWLEGLGYEVSAFDGPSACLEALATDEALRTSACLLFDVRMPEMSGLQLLDALRERGVDRPVIFMTGHGDVPLAVEAMRKGALTFLEKPFQEAALEDALRQAFAERAPARPWMEAAHPAAEGAGEDPEYERRLASLTPREREVMELVVLGHPNKVIAYSLDVSPKTVELHRSRVMAKMQAVSFTQLVRMAMSRSVEAG
jgi:two-component system, LuxR family, response regulator FixJ